MDHQPSWILDRFMNHKMDGSLKRFFKIYKGEHDMDPVLNFEWHNGRDIHLDDVTWIPKAFWMANMNWMRNSDTATEAITTMSGYKLNLMNPKNGGAFLFYKLTHSGHWGLDQNKQGEIEIDADGELYGDLARAWVETTTGEYGEDFYAITVTHQYYKRHFFDKITFKAMPVPAGKESWYAGKTFATCGSPEAYAKPVLRREHLDIYAYHTYDQPDTWTDVLVVNLEANTAECIKNVNAQWFTERDEGEYLALLVGKQGSIETWELVGDKSIDIKGDSAQNGEANIKIKGNFGKDAELSDKFNVRKASKCTNEGFIALASNKVTATGSWVSLPISSANAFGNGVQYGVSGIAADKVKIDFENSSAAAITLPGFEGNLDNFYPLGNNKFLAWTDYVKENNQYAHKWWLLNCPFVEGGATSCSVVQSGSWNSQQEVIREISVFGNVFIATFQS
jgi:hypothetical protein